MSKLLLLFFCASSLLSLSAVWGLAVSQDGSEKCDIYEGNWMQDARYPLYSSADCPFLDDQFNCQKYGRPNSSYLSWRWKPISCDLPRFNALDMVERLKGKKMMFVGDSLSRNQWQSMVCLLFSGLHNSRTSYAFHDPIYSFNFVDYGLDVMFHRAPYLVDMEAHNVNGQRRQVLQLESVERNGLFWKNADVLVFNTGHWWSHNGQNRGWDYARYGDKMYRSIDPLVGFLRGMASWAKWVDTNIDFNKTRVYFQSYSPSHAIDRHGRSCYGQEEPAAGLAFTNRSPKQLRIAEAVLARKKGRVELLNVTGMSMSRKDGHPSIYNNNNNRNDNNETRKEGTGESSMCDCNHWCVPGVPDAWNELLYASLFFIKH